MCRVSLYQVGIIRLEYTLADTLFPVGWRIRLLDLKEREKKEL